MLRDLIIDVGMHNGDDTAYYLHLGYRVLAIEANPILAEDARRRFATEIGHGRLTILNKGISDEQTISPFYVCEKHSEWSSFNKEVASRDGAPFRVIDVPCVTMTQVLRQYGMPFFLKVDIEGNDKLAVFALTEGEDLPKYVSFEMGKNTEPMLSHLHRIGFDRFKLISQRNFAPLKYPPNRDVKRLHFRCSLIDGASLGSKVARRIGREPLRRLVIPTLTDRDWTFRPGSSGPFGEATPGRWLTLEELRSTHAHFQRSFQRRQRSPFWGERGWSFWADIHAMRSIA